MTAAAGRYEQTRHAGTPVDADDRAVRVKPDEIEREAHAERVD